MAAKADRALNKALNAKAYANDLLQDIENGTLKFETIDPAQLTDDLRSLSPAERQQQIEKRLAERREIRSQIMELSKQRDAFIDGQKKKQRGARSDGFDEAVSRVLRLQIFRK